MVRYVCQPVRVLQVRANGRMVMSEIWLWELVREEWVQWNGEDLRLPRMFAHWRRGPPPTPEQLELYIAELFKGFADSLIEKHQQPAKQEYGILHYTVRNIRDAPSAHADRVGLYYQGDKFPILAKAHDDTWYQTDKGWVWHSNIEIVWE